MTRIRADKVRAANAALTIRIIPVTPFRDELIEMIRRAEIEFDEI